MAKKRSLKKDDEEQSNRFIETAKELSADESGVSFDNATKKIATAKAKAFSDKQKG